jgi:glutaredoxin
MIGLLCLCLVTTVLGCTSTGSTTSEETGSKKIDIMLDRNQLLSQNNCEQLDLESDITMIGSRYCPHCNAIDPILEDIAQEQNLTYKKYDIVDADEKQAIIDKGISAKSVPVTIIGCRVLIGERTEQEFQEVINQQLK